MFKIERNTDPCGECLLERCEVPLRTKRAARFLVVTNPPTPRLVTKGRHIGGFSANLFAKHMQANGFSAGDFSFQAGIMCAFDPDEHARVDRTFIYTTCREHFLRALERVRPDVIICLGAEAARQVYKREVKITKERGIIKQAAFILTPVEQHQCYILPMLDPAKVAAYPQYEQLFAVDCKALRKFIDADMNLERLQEEALGEYFEIHDLQFLIDMEPELLSLDTETTGLDPRAPGAQILTIQFCVREGEAYFLSLNHPMAKKSLRAKHKLKQQLAQLLGNPKTKIIGHNLKFDALWIAVHMGIRFKVAHDTLIMTSVLDENSTSKDLATQIKLHVPDMHGYSDALDSTYNKARMAEVPLIDLIPYAAGDVDAVFRLFKVLYTKLRRDKAQLRSYSRVTMAGMNAFIDIEMRGMDIDTQALDEFESVVQQIVDEEYETLIEQVPLTIRRKHMEKGLKFTRTDFVRDILFLHEDGFCLTPKEFTKSTARLAPERRVPTTSAKTHLPYFFEECPFSEALATHAKNLRLLGTNIKRFRTQYIKPDGKIYPEYKFHVAVTGRLSSASPNAQNFPQHGPMAKAYKKIFRAPEGYAVLGADLSQAELRVAADMAREPTMMRVYRNNGDIHAETAQGVMGLSDYEWRSMSPEEIGMARFNAKCVNFGYIYGAWWTTFQRVAKSQYGLDYTDEQAEASRTAFFRKYYKLEGWQRSMKQFAHKHGYVRSYCGRVRHLPQIRSEDENVMKEAERQAINSSVQAYASQWAVRAIVDVQRHTSPDDLQIIGFVHDAIYALVPLDLIEWGAKTLKFYMENVDEEKLFKRKMRVPMVADVAFGKNTGELHEMKGMSLDKRYRMGVHDVDFDIPTQNIN